MTRGMGTQQAVWAWDTFRAILTRAAKADPMAAETVAAQFVVVLEDLVARSDAPAIRSAVAVVGPRRGWGVYARGHARAHRGGPEAAVTATTATSTATSRDGSAGARKGWLR